MGMPLEGIVVADFSRVLAGPLATMTLADLGAEVIKVERPGAGDGSVTLDLRDEADLLLARELIRRADVVVENFKPGTMERLGLDYATVCQDNPGLVYCSITGFGADQGAHLLGYDFVVQAVGGLMSITGDEHPTKAGVALVDVLTGKDATIGILAALAARARTGMGERLEVALLTSSLAAMVNQGQAALQGVVPGRMGNQHPSISPYETLACADADIAVACGNDVQFQRMCQVLGLPDLAVDDRFATNPARVLHRAGLIEALEARLSTMTAAECVSLLNSAEVPAGPVNDLPQAIEFADELGLEPTVSMGAEGLRGVRHPVSWTRYETREPTQRCARGCPRRRQAAHSAHRELSDPRDWVGPCPPNPPVASFGPRPPRPGAPPSTRPNSASSTIPAARCWFWPGRAPARPRHWSKPSSTASIVAESPPIRCWH